jgi:hypothetical protein
MVAAWLKIALLVLKAPLAAQELPSQCQNVLSGHQNASTAEVPAGTDEFCKRLNS